jgi:hypothetical protein
MPLTIDDRVHVSEQVVYRTIEGEAVLLHLERGLYFGLDPIGTRVWETLVQHGCARPALGPLAAEFDVTGETLTSDVTRLLAELVDSGLIQPGAPR